MTKIAQDFLKTKEKTLESLLKTSPEPAPEGKSNFLNMNSDAVHFKALSELRKSVSTEMPEDLFKIVEAFMRLSCS